MPPGSPQAIQSGCLCPMEENFHGEHAPHLGADLEPLWWVQTGCPIHWPLTDD